MLGNIKGRIFSSIMSAVLMFTNINPIMPIELEDEPESTTELTYQSIELYPNGEEAEQVVTLDGMMPEGAEAVAVDVSADYEGVAAYDISISSEIGDYQPGEENPIFVESTDPVITESIELWHIHDDGYREQVFDFSVEEGKVSFYATGFSVYEIVREESVTLYVPIFESVTSLDDLTGKGQAAVFICIMVMVKRHCFQAF